MPLVYGLCFKYFRDQAKSEDAVMQIFESLVTKLRQHEVLNFKPWLYTLARNHCLMSIRQTKHITTVEIDEAVEMAHQYDDSDVYFKEDQLNRLDACLNQLSEEQATCVRLFYLQKKYYKEIAELTGFEMSKVKSYIQNGKRNLKICMERSAAHGQ